MKPPIPVCIAMLLWTTIAIQAQDFQGKAYYESKTTVDMGAMGGRGNQMTEEQKKQMAERMKSMFEKTFVLTFNRTESLYREEEKLETPGAGGNRRGVRIGGLTAGPQYKNVKDNKLLQAQEFFGKQFLIKDSLPKLEWKMENETKQIGQYMCFKATTIKKTEDMDVVRMRPRNRGNDTEKAKDTAQTNAAEASKEIVVTAWYAPQIPVNQGPGDYWGLPGLILEVNTDRTTILCSKIVINPAEKETIKAPSKGKEVTQAEYDVIVREKIEEMQEMNGGRRGNQRF